MGYASPEAKVAHMARKRERAKVYLGGKCVRCGATEDLQFDHIDPATKSFTITAHLNRRWEVLVVELDKCQLLCRPHHLEKTVAESGVEHGGGASGKKNCPCAPCKARKAEYMATYRR